MTNDYVTDINVGKIESEDCISRQAAINAIYGCYIGGSSDDISKAIEKITRLQREYEEQKLAEIITKYDFIVGSKECKSKLMEVLPEGANIICSPYVESPTTIYVIKKFDPMDFYGDRTESGGEE